MNRNTKWAAALMLSASLAITACGGAAKPSGSGAPASDNKTKQLVIGMSSSPHSFDPVVNEATYGKLVTSLIYPSLVDMNDKLQFEGRLAETWNTSEDLTKYTFHLRKNAQWSDGSPITADDVKYFYDTIANPDTPTVRRSDINYFAGTDKDGKAQGGISGVKVIDADTIEFTMKNPVDPATFLEKAASLHFEPKKTLEAVTDKKNLDKADFALHPTVDGGAFHFVKYETDQYVELAANKNYFMGPAKLDKVFIKVVNQAGMLAAVQKGEVDITAGVGIGEIPITDWETAKSLPNVTPVTYPAPNFQYMEINTRKPEFKDKRVRQALAYAINRKLMVSRLLKGNGEVLNTPLNSVNKYYRKDVQSAYDYNPEKAKQLLKDAGFDLSTKIELIVPTGNVVREQSGDVILQNLKDVGLNVQLSKMDFSTMQGRAKQGDYQLRLAGFSTDFDPDFSSMVGTGQGFNYSGYSNPALDQILQTGKSSAKFEDRKAAYDQAQDMFVAELPMLPLYSPNGLTVVNKRVIAAKPSPNFLTWNAYLWDVQ